MSQKSEVHLRYWAWVTHNSEFLLFYLKNDKCPFRFWLKSMCILFHVSPSLHFTVRATAYHNTWHFKEKSQKIQIFADQQCWKQLLMKCKGIMYRRRVFSLDSTFKLIFNEKSSTWDKMLHLILLLGMYSPRKSCWKA